VVAVLVAVAALAFISLIPAIAIAIAMVALARGGRCSTALIVAQAPLAVALLPAALSLDADPVARPDADTGRWAMVVVFGECGRYADTQHDGSEGEHRKSTRGKAYHSDPPRVACPPFRKQRRRHIAPANRKWIFCTDAA
jgi:hypothetical protein